MPNRKFILLNRPEGLPKESDFKLIEEENISLNNGELRLDTKWISLDPYMRGSMNERVDIGETMIGETIGKVIESRSEKIPKGSLVLCKSGWQTQPIINAEHVSIIDSRIKPISLSLGALGMPGLTAYFGLLRLGRPIQGETVVISAGSGAVGAVVGQIAKNNKCRVVGIAGSELKVKYMKDELGFDEGINYKLPNWKDDFRKICPSSVDIYFDNVGGVISDVVIQEMNTGARVLVCGQISQYNNEVQELGPRNLGNFLWKKAKLQGFMVSDYINEYEEGIDYLLSLKKSSKLTFKETIIEGFDNTPSAFIKLFHGQNFGKLLIKI